jgi:hypothetical protein
VGFAAEFPLTKTRVADAHSCDGKRFVVRADEKLTAFVELESGIKVAAANCWLDSSRDFSQKGV